MGSEAYIGRTPRDRTDRETDEGGLPQPIPVPVPVVPPTTPPPVTTPVTNSTWLPPGVDPYYGLTISNLTGGTGSSGGGTTPGTPPIDIDSMGPKQQLWSKNKPGQDEYNKYVASGGGLSYNDWALLMNSASTASTDTGAYSGPFQIATPNMTWANSLPTVMPAGGGAAAQQYGPMPFTREANTPGVTYNPPPLTYFNPYNTNPYLPTSNPFALVPNNTGTTQ
jgi:hypothetical protein